MAQQTQSRTTDPEYRTEEIVFGTVMRITGAGNFIVYPSSRSDGVRVGNPVRIIASTNVRSGTMPALELREERISTPMSSVWAIVVSGHRSIERCGVYYNGVRLNTVDHMGKLRSEARMPRDGSLSFHIPDSMELVDTYPVEVRDGDRLLRSETLGSIRAAPAMVVTPTSTVGAAGMVFLEARQDRIAKPISSNWAIVVSGQHIERCQVFYNNAQLSTIDQNGNFKPEARLEPGTSLSYRIPDSMEISDAYMVQVRDGNDVLRNESFGSIRSTAFAKPRP